MIVEDGRFVKNASSSSAIEFPRTEMHVWCYTDFLLRLLQGG